jgi:hypothetical protein
MDIAVGISWRTEKQEGKALEFRSQTRGRLAETCCNSAGEMILESIYYI